MKRFYIFKKDFFCINCIVFTLLCSFLPLNGSLNTTFAQSPNPTANAADANSRPISLEQLKKLIGSQVPDNVIAGEIRQRGINFGSLLTRRILEDLQTDGAGPKTIRTLEAYLPKSSLRVITKIEKSVVFVDNKQYGQTGLDGTLQIADLEPGEHLVEVRNRPRYGDAQQRIVLRPNESQEVALALELNIGYLTVTPNVQNATIAVRGAGATSLTGVFANREVPLGSYTVEATSPDHQPFRQTVEIRSGQSVVVEARLDIDQASVVTMLESAQRAFATKDYRTSIKLAQRVADISPKDAPSLSLLAQSYFRINDAQNFLAVARKAIENGAKLDFPVLVRGDKSAGSYPARLRLTAAELILEPESNASRQIRTIPLENLASVQIAGDLRDEAFLSIGLQKSDASKKANEINLAYAPEPAADAKLSQRDTLNALWNLEDLLESASNAQKELLKLRPETKTVRFASATDVAPSTKKTKASQPEEEKKEKKEPSDEGPSPENVSLDVDKLLKRTPTRKQRVALAKVKMKLAELPPDQRVARIFIDQAIRRAGGLNALKKISGAMYEGFQASQPDNVDRPAIFYWTKTIQYREDIKIGGSSRITVYDAPAGWERTGNLPSSPLPGDGLKQRRIQAKLFGPGLYLQLVENEDRAQRTRMTKQDGVDIEIIRITDKEGDTYEIHFNGITLLPEKCVYQIATQSGLITIEDIFSEFMQVQGIRLPTQQMRSVNGALTLRTRFKDLELEKPNASLFKKP